MARGHTDLQNTIPGMYRLQSKAILIYFPQHRYQHTDAVDSSTVSLAPMLLMSDVRIGQTLITILDAYNAYYQTGSDRITTKYITCCPIQMLHSNTTSYHS